MADSRERVQITLEKAQGLRITTFCGGSFETSLPKDEQELAIWKEMVYCDDALRVFTPADPGKLAVLDGTDRHPKRVGLGWFEELTDAEILGRLGIETIPTPDNDSPFIVDGPEDESFPATNIRGVTKAPAEW